jgi:hypothetical protein
MKKLILAALAISCSCSNDLILDQQSVVESVIIEVSDTIESKTEDKIDDAWEYRQPIGFTATVNGWSDNDVSID